MGTTVLSPSFPPPSSTTTSVRSGRPVPRRGTVGAGAAPGSDVPPSRHTESPYPAATAAVPASPTPVRKRRREIPASSCAFMSA